MTKLSPTQIYGLAIQAGWGPVEAVQATAIALAESSGDPNVVNGIGAMGLWQIYDGVYPSQARVQQMSDPLANARAAYGKYASSQKTQCGGWWPWATYDEGACAARNEAGRNNSWRTYLGMAQAAATGVDIAGGGGSLVTGGGDSSSGAAGTVVQTGAGQSVSGVGASSSSQLSLANLGPWSLNVGTGLLWAVLFGLGAIALVVAGVYLVFRTQIDRVVEQGARAAAVMA